MDNRRLLTFLTAARLGSLSRAAEALYVTQSTVTTRINELERELNCQLFIREARGVTLTEAGRVFVRYAQRALQSWEEGRAAVASLHSGIRGDLRIMACHVPATYDLPALLRGTPLVTDARRIHIQTRSSKRIFRDMLQGSVDVGFVHVRFRHPDLETEVVAETPLVAVASPQRAKRPALDPYEVLFFFEEELEDALLAQSICHQFGLTPASAVGLSDMAALKAFVKQGFGIGIVPRATVADEIAQGTLLEMELEGTSSLPKQITCLVVRKEAMEGESGALVRQFVDNVRRYYERKGTLPRAAEGAPSDGVATDGAPVPADRSRRGQA